MALLAVLPNANAQTGQRISLHSLTSTPITGEQQKLADLINAWLDENPNIPIEHKNCFEEGIHSTNNFLPWHRVHIQQLEDYIREHAIASDFPNIPNINDESFRLPYWKPEDVPLTGQKIPTAFQVTFDPLNYPINTPLSTMNFNPDPTQFPEMSDFLNNRLIPCSNLGDAGFFSNVLEGKYHDHGHTSVGGRFNEGDAPACLIFWPWHAWIDDLWYIWERDCGASSEPYNFPLANGQTETVFNGSPPAWTGTMYIKGTIRIKNGATLTIAPGAVIHFRESQYNAFPTRIIVEPGGKLVVNSDATLTGIEEFGVCGDGDDPNDGCNGTGEGSMYYSGWEGIIVEGNPFNPSLSAQGQVELWPNATIEHAVTGIRSVNGGYILAQSAKFLNNRFDVEILPQGKFSHPSYFYNCSFKNDDELRDIVWVGGDLQAIGDCPGGTPEHHTNHLLTHSSEVHIRLEGVKYATFDGCTIDNTFRDEHGHYKSVGIEANNSRYLVKQCSIRNQTVGILGSNTYPGSGQNLNVRNTVFDYNYAGIKLTGVDYSIIKENTFRIPFESTDPMPEPDPIPNPDVPVVPYGIYSDGAFGLTIYDNFFRSVDKDGIEAVSTFNRGAVLTNTTDLGATLGKRNTFTGVAYASQAQWDNSGLQIKCNSYNTFVNGIAVTSGVLADQGACADHTTPAGNTWDNLNNCLGNESQIYKDASASNFIYNHHSNLTPTCYSPGITPLPCQEVAGTTSCLDTEPPCEGCEFQRITSLEAQKGTLASGDPLLQMLSFEQQIVFQAEITELLEEDKIDSALLFVDNVGQIMTLNPVHKASLLLLKSEQEGGIASGTSAAIAAVPSADPLKTWLDLRYELLVSGRDYTQLTPAEKSVVESEATQLTKSGAHARAVRAIALGIPALTIIEPVGQEERDARRENTVPGAKYLSVFPNPTQGAAQISFVVPEISHRSALVLTDVDGRILRSFDVSDSYGSSGIGIHNADLPSGVIFIRLVSDGKLAGVEKLVVIR